MSSDAASVCSAHQQRSSSLSVRQTQARQRQRVRPERETTHRIALLPAQP